MHPRETRDHPGDEARCDAGSVARRRLGHRAATGPELIGMGYFPDELRPDPLDPEGPG